MSKLSKKGVAALMTVIIILASVLVIGIIIAQMGINEVIFGLQGSNSHKLLEVADSCAEEGYYRLKRDSGYTGGTLTFPEGSCTISVGGTEPNRTFTVQATIEELTRNFTMSVDARTNLGGNARGVDLTEWSE